MVIMYTFITCSVGATERTKPAYVYVRVPDNRGNAWLSCQFSSPLIHLQYDLGVSSYYSMSSQYIAHTRTRVSTRIYRIVGGFHGMVASNAIQYLPFLSFHQCHHHIHISSSSESQSMSMSASFASRFNCARPVSSSKYSGCCSASLTNSTPRSRYSFLTTSEHAVQALNG